MSIIQANNVWKSYGNTEVLKGVNLQIEEKEIVSIVGSSGAGKSTLLYLLGTLDKADSGTIHIVGNDIRKLSKKKIANFRNKEIGFVFQFHNLLPEFTALENVCLPGFVAGRKPVEVKKEAQRILEVLHLTHRIDAKPSELSGGEQQRVAVARALINNPKVVFADEPSGNLDSKNSKDLHELFFLLREELHKTFVIVTHNERLANMSDRKLIMQDGVIV